jgi:capsule polysaccharide export protein KpsC/LpsZ
MVDVVRNLLPRLPEHIHLITPTDKTNSYDLVDIARLGLVYTTTMGLEMSMSGVPVIVAGQTHYRGRGFTFDPDNWVNYYKMLGGMLDDETKAVLTEDQVKMAWAYAYSFFFEYARPFPWHLVKMWDDFDRRPFSFVLSKEGQAEYGTSFDYLIGKKLNWAEIFADRTDKE